MKTDILPTDRTYKVLAIARDVATFEGCEIILPIHLLHGLLLERDGIAGTVLASVEIQAENELREAINYPSSKEYETWRKCGIREVPLLSGPAKLVYESAAQEGRDLFQKMLPTSWPYKDNAWPYIGTEHLLLGLLNVPESSAYQYLETKMNEKGLKPIHMRDVTLNLIFGPSRE
ncbi:Clp amino terminal domain protein [Gimesia aquarii]|uniref:Clp amino terminal domain protein n=2 Tax=Gimesia aquarii TaxID=2527964 RepID=A0A517VTT1_9PLAN|nr:Clp amino terminal domain protein [Gimesia aquarii]